MGDHFGLQGAVDGATKGGVTFSKVVLFRLLVAEAEQIHDKEEDLKVEFRNIERKVTRGEWPKLEKFEKMSGDCDTLAKKVRTNHKVVLKMVKEDMRVARNAGADSKKIKLIMEVEDKLDDIGAFLMKQQRRPSAGELTLDLLNRRGSNVSEKGPKRAPSVDAKKPGTHLWKEVEYFNKNNKEDELKSIAKDRKKFNALDDVVTEGNRVGGKLDLFQKFMSSPRKDAVGTTRDAVAQLSKLEDLMEDAKRALEALGKAFKRLERDMKDNKDVPASLQGSLEKAANVIEKLDEELKVKGEGKTAKEKFDAECKKLEKA